MTLNTCSKMQRSHAGVFVNSGAAACHVCRGRSQKSGCAATAVVSRFMSLYTCSVNQSERWRDTAAATLS